MSAEVTAGLSAEQRFILECCSRAFALPGLEETGPSRSPSLNWELAVDLARGEGLAPLFSSSVISSQQPVPDGVLTQLRMSYYAAVSRTSACLEPTLTCALQTLIGLGIEPIVLKGAALAYTAYPDAAQRGMADIDLLIAGDEIGRAGDVLLEAGFSTIDADPEPEHHLRAHYAPEWRMGVELHRHLLPEPNPYAVNELDCLTRCQTAEIAGVRARVLGPVDALHFACLHLAYAHRYRWFPLRTLTDILAITASPHQGLDWDLFVRVVKSSRSGGSVYWPLLLSRDWLGAPIPEEVLSGLAPPAAMRRLIASVVDFEYIVEGRAPLGNGEEVLYNLLLTLSLYQGCSRLDQARAVSTALFPPPEAVGHLSPAVAHSRLSYSAHLARPGRVARGLMAFGRLVGRMSGKLCRGWRRYPRGVSH